MHSLVTTIYSFTNNTYKNIFILLISAKYLINYFLIYAIKYKNMHY